MVVKYKYLYSLIIWCIFLFIKIQLKDLLNGEEFPLLSLSVVLVAIYSGLRPALMNAFLSVIAEFYFFLDPVEGPNASYILASSLFVYAGIIITMTVLIGRQMEYEKKLSALYEQQSQWVANVSHEVRTPLNGILGILEILKAENLTQNQAKFIEYIEKSSLNLKSIVDRILNFAKIESQTNRTQNHSQFSLNEFTQHIVDTYSPRFYKKNISLQFNKLDQDILIYENQTNLSQILTNILENSLKYTRQGQVVLNLKMASKLENQCQIQFEISDTGIGIHKDELVHIFEPYYRAVNSKHEYEGIGLGLSIVQKLVHDLNGTIQVDSTPNKGSQFLLSLPLQLATTNPTIKPNLAPTISNHFQLALIVEDNLMNQIVLQNQLRNLGIHSLIAENGLDAIVLYHEHHFDFIIIDAHMPKQNGYETAKQIRQYEHQKNIRPIPILCITADVTFKLSKDSPFNQILYKPISQTEINSALATTLNSISNNIPENIHQTIRSIFVKETPLKIKQIRMALNEQNFLEIQNVSHNLKSSFYAIGENNSAAICQNIYDSAAKSDLANLQSSISDLESKFESIQQSPQV